MKFAVAQGSVVTYQGRLDSGGIPYTGNAEFQATLWDASSGGSQVGTNTPGVANVTVTNGLFVLPLDFGTEAFAGGSGRWLQLDARTTAGAFATLLPRQKLTATPYALAAGNLTGPLPASQITGVLGGTNLNGIYPSAVTFNNPANSFSGVGAGLTALNANELSGGTVPDARLAANLARTNQVWLLGGNAGAQAGQFIGTSDNRPLELKVNNVRALRMEDNGDGSEADGIRNGAPNVIAGSPTNFVAAGVVGATISGGGATNYYGSQWPNIVRADYSVVAGGLYNRVESNSMSASISGGQFHQILANSSSSAIGGGNQNSIGAGSQSSTIAGGESNDIRSNAPLSTISGGFNNTVNGSFSTIGGGRENNTGNNAFSASIGGGDDNNIAGDASFATIAGGHINDIGVFAAASVISGGEDNNIGLNSEGTTIAGGRFNDIGSNSIYSVITGGQDNNIGAATGYSFIAGGVRNNIGTGSSYAMVAGGQDNNVAPDSSYAAIGGGWLNAIGTNSPGCTVGGGDDNKIGANSRNASIAGGAHNGISDNAAFAAISGGTVNSIAQSSPAATIGGGSLHRIGTNSAYGTIGGGYWNLISSNSEAATISGGSQNVIGNSATYSAIGGGEFNNVADGSRYSVIAGGFYNTNAPNSLFATIPGGRYNFATSNAFAAGSFARAAHSGTFVWADATDLPLTSTNANSITLRASGGYRLFSGLNVGAYLAPNSSSWAVISDRNAKKDFTAVNSIAVLEKLASMPITKWHYKWESTDSTPNIGPMAQDFKAAFYPGRDDKSITTQEADGVALAAIQGLNRKLTEELKRRDIENTALKARLEKIEALLARVNTAAD